MSNAQHTVENNGYEYTVQPLVGGHSESVSLVQAACYAHFMAAYENANKEWEEKVKNDPYLKYGDGWYLYSMTIGVEGEPAALIMNVDDIVQTFPFETPEKVEDDR